MEAQKKLKSVMNLPTPPKYEIFNHDTAKDFACIRIVEGEYDGIEYHYTKVSVGEDTGENEVPFLFEYELMDQSLINKLDIKELEGVMCSILFHLIENMDNVKSTS